MTDEKQNHQQDELRDLDLPAEQAEGVKGGLGAANDVSHLSLRTAPPKPPGLGTRSGGEVVSSDAY